MAHRNGLPKIANPTGDRLSVYLDSETGERVRRYCLKHGISFSHFAWVALTYWMDHRDPPKNEALKLPTGKRIKSTR